MIIPNLKDEVKDGKKVKFIFYKENELWYETESGFEFSVPIETTGSGKFLAEDRAMLFMKWIRNQINYWKEIEAEAGRAKCL